MESEMMPLMLNPSNMNFMEIEMIEATRGQNVE
jgi:hypothetical protein